MRGLLLSGSESEFWLLGLARRYYIGDGYPSHLFDISSSFTALFEFQPDSANGVPKERHTAYIHGRRILLHLRRDCVVKLPRSKREWGVFSGVSHIFFGNRFFLHASHGFYKLTQIFASLCTVARPILKSIFGTPQQEVKARLVWLVDWLDNSDWLG